MKTLPILFICLFVCLFARLLLHFLLGLFIIKFRDHRAGRHDETDAIVKGSITKAFVSLVFGQARIGDEVAELVLLFQMSLYGQIMPLV